MRVIRLDVAEGIVGFLTALFTTKSNMKIQEVADLSESVYVGLTEDAELMATDQVVRVVVSPGALTGSNSTLDDNLEEQVYGINPGDPDNSETFRDTISSETSITITTKSWAACERVAHEVYYALRIHAEGLSDQLELTKMAVRSLSAPKKTGDDFVAVIQIGWNTDFVWSYERTAPKLKAVHIPMN